MNINFKEGRPFVESVCLDEIINFQPTPFYLYSQKKIYETFTELKSALNTEIFFAVKSNSNQAILRIMKNCGCGADTVSTGEIERSLAAGFNPNKIIFEGIGKTKDDINYAINNNIKLINIESFNEINLINQIGKDLDKVIDVGIRLNPDIDAETLNKISTGKKTDKFGININQLDDIILLIKASNYINLISISCHIGSQINNLNIFNKLFTKMKKTADIFLSKNIKIQYVDLGGGLAVNYNQAENDLNIIKIGKLVKFIFDNVPYKISFEPGRYLIAKAGIIITKIITTKENGGINFLVTDAGMQTLIRPAMYGEYHRIEAINDLEEGKTIYDVVGPICESSDILSKDIFLSQQKIGNYLVIHDTGAYGAVMSSNYNSRGISAEILINESKFAVIHKAETSSEIIKRDFIPKWL